MTSIRTFYFCYFAGTASLLPFFALYYERIGLSGPQIGLLMALPPLTNLFVASLWGTLADATKWHKRLWSIAILGSLLLALAFQLAATFPQLVFVALAFAIFSAPIIPLADNAALMLLGKNKSKYGQLRLWGTVGSGLSAPIIGQLVARSDLHWAFWGYAFFMAMSFFVTLRTTVPQVSVGSTVWRGMSALLRDRRWPSFLIVIFVAGAGFSLIYNYLFLYMEHLGASESLMGLAFTISKASDAVILFLSSRMLERWGTRNTLMLALGALVVRLLAYSLISAPLLVLGVQLLQGLTVALLVAAGVPYANHIAPHGMGATAQGLFTGVTFGLSASVGAFIGGAAYDRLGLSQTFGIAGLLVLAALSLMLARERAARRASSQITEQV
jgi:PPP family 3-phenylpropionic acid transporter